MAEEPTPTPDEPTPAEAAPESSAANSAPAEPPAAEQSPPAPAEVAAAAQPAGEQPSAAEGAPGESSAEPAEAPARAKPAVPGADLEVDIVPEGVDPLARRAAAGEYGDYANGGEAAGEEAGADAVEAVQPIAQVAIDLGAGARYRATGKRKTAIARVILRPGSGSYTINGKTLDDYFPRVTLQRNIRQPLETVGYEAKMDVVARMHGGGISAQAGALRHGISRALLEADPNLRGELKRRGFLTRDARAKERKKAGLKKARKRPQFSKR
ncbi:MAG: hypothetical protein NVSMB51_11330 [Solirubrobacteraceae bacterium]